MRLYSVDKVLLGYVPNFDGQTLRFYKYQSISVSTPMAKQLVPSTAEWDWVFKGYDAAGEAAFCQKELDPYIIPGFVPIVAYQQVAFTRSIPWTVTPAEKCEYGRWLEHDIANKIFDHIRPSIMYSDSFDKLNAVETITGQLIVGRRNNDRS